MPQQNQQQRGKSPRRTKPSKGNKSGDKVRGVRRTKSGDSITSRKRTPKFAEGNDALQDIPKEYLSKPEKAEPILYYLPKTSSSSNNESQNTGGGNAKSNKFPNLRVLLSAAQDDIRLHRARQQAGKYRDPKLISTYKIENDQSWLTRQQRLHERDLLLGKLDMESNLIVKELMEGNTAGLTAKESTAIQLARWQRALELYVYDPPTRKEDNTADEQLRKSTSSTGDGGTIGAQALQTGQQNQHDQSTQNLDFLQLLEKLREIIGEEDDMTESFSQASNMCSTLVEVTRQITKDATEAVLEVSDAYQIRLEAHELFCRNALGRTEEIQNQFRINGRAALQIGNQLEFAESKRKRCESASVLIRRWWLMESQAEQENMSGETLKVREEVRGSVPLTSCRMDPLFTRPENSIEASRALRQLRQVVKSRGNAASANMQTGKWEKSDVTSSRRFELTADLIRRTSEALEERLLNSFTSIYGRGGAYEFNTAVTIAPKHRTGTIAWQELRDIAHACWLFEGGRKLYDAYVNMVVATRLPELFDTEKMKKLGEDDDEGQIHERKEDFDIDTARSQLSSLFHRVSEVFMEEFRLIGYVFDYSEESEGAITESIPLTVARALCVRVIGDPKNGLQSKINRLLEQIDQKSDFDTGTKKLDTFVIIHDKAASLFEMLKNAAERLVQDKNAGATAINAVESLKVFLNSQEISLNNSHRAGYLNLELRLLHHECCASLDQAGCTLTRPTAVKINQSILDKGLLEEYQAPLLALDKNSLRRSGFNDILTGPLKASVLRQPLVHATESLGRARLMFGNGREMGDSAARVVTSIYSQMCTFYGQAFLYPVVESLQEMLKTNAPNQAPQLPFDEEQPAHNLGIDPTFWVALERIHSAAKAFDRELWAEPRKGSNRVWDILASAGEGAETSNSVAVARECRVDFFTELESRGEDAILRALDTLGAHIHWILVTGSEAALSSGTVSLFKSAAGNSGGPYAMTSGSSLEAPNSPAVKSLAYCLRVQFVHIQAALTPQSLSAFWSALSVRLYDILVMRLLQNWYVSTVGAVILARDVEALRSVAMLAGTKHEHWDILRELLTLYMTPPDALKIILVGPEGDPNSGKGLFGSAGRDQSLIFMSRRVDYRYKTNQGQKKNTWVNQILNELHVRDPTDSYVDFGMFAAGRK